MDFFVLCIAFVLLYRKKHHFFLFLWDIYGIKYTRRVLAFQERYHEYSKSRKRVSTIIMLIIDAVITYSIAKGKWLSLTLYSTSCGLPSRFLKACLLDEEDPEEPYPIWSSLEFAGAAQLLFTTSRIIRATPERRTLLLAIVRLAQVTAADDTAAVDLIMFLVWMCRIVSKCKLLFNWVVCTELALVVMERNFLVSLSFWINILVSAWEHQKE